MGLRHSDTGTIEEEGVALNLKGKESSNPKEKPPLPKRQPKPMIKSTWTKARGSPDYTGVSICSQQRGEGAIYCALWLTVTHEGKPSTAPPAGLPPLHVGLKSCPGRHRHIAEAALESLFSKLCTEDSFQKPLLKSVEGSQPTFLQTFNINL